jgi:hypothetical protein
VSVMIVPAAVPAVTVTTTGNVLVEPGATLGLVQLMDPVVVQVHPAGTGLSELNVVLTGIASVNVAVVQLLGPLLVTTCVYVIVLPAATGLGLPLFVTAKSQSALTFVMTVVVLLLKLGSLVVGSWETEELAVIDETATVDATLTTTMMAADAPEATLGLVQFTLPVAPTAGVVHDQPAGTEMEAKVVFVGTASVKLALAAVPGPLLVTVCA